MMRRTRDGSGRGGFGLIAATFTACHADGAVNLRAIEQQAEGLTRGSLRGAFVCGTSGETASLTFAERMDIAQRWTEVAGEDLEIVVHVGHTCLSDAQALAAHAEEIGAAGIAAVPPYYFRPRTVAELVAFMAEVAAAAPRTPFYYYHIPVLTAVNLPMAEFLPAAIEAIPTLAGIKFTHENLVDYARCLEIGGGRFEMFIGRDESFLSALALGAQSAVGTTYNVAAPLFQSLAEAFEMGNLEEARRLQNLANRMIEIAVGHGGLPAFKAMMRWFGVDCGPCRLPLPTLGAERVAELYADLEEIGFFAAVSGPTYPVSNVAAALP